VLALALMAAPTWAQKFLHDKEIKHPQPIFYVTALSPEGNLLAAANPDEREIHLANPQTGKWNRKIALDQVHRLTFLPDGRSLLAISGQRVVQIDLATEKVTERLATQPRALVALAVLPTGKHYLVAQDNASVYLHDLVTGKRLRTFAVTEGGIHAMDVSADGTRLVVACNDGAHVYDIETGKKIASYEPKRDASCHSVAFSPDGRTVASGHFEPHLHIWEVRTSQLRRRSLPSDHLVRRAVFSPDGRSLAFHWNGFRMKVWDLRRDTTMEVGRRWPNYPHHLHWDVRNRFLIAALTGWEAHVFRIEPSEAPAHKPMRTASAWTALAGNEAEPAYEGMWSLARSEAGRKALLARVREQLRDEKAQRERLARWLRDLEAEEFAVREKASAELTKQRGAIDAELRAALKASASPESRRRLQRILGDTPVPLARLLPERLRMFRAIEALEYAAHPDSDALLAELAKEGLPGEQIEARESLARRKRTTERQAEGTKDERP
jgi:hypothetical protein